MYCCVIFLGLPQQITTKLAKQKYTLTVLEARGPKSGVTVTVLPPWRARARAPSLACRCSLPGVTVPVLPPWRARAPSLACPCSLPRLQGRIRPFPLPGLAAVGIPRLVASSLCLHSHTASSSSACLLWASPLFVTGFSSYLENLSRRDDSRFGIGNWDNGGVTG